MISVANGLWHDLRCSNFVRKNVKNKKREIKLHSFMFGTPHMTTISWVYDTYVSYVRYNVFKAATNKFRYNWIIDYQTLRSSSQNSSASNFKILWCSVCLPQKEYIQQVIPSSSLPTTSVICRESSMQIRMSLGISISPSASWARFRMKRGTVWWWVKQTEWPSATSSPAADQHDPKLLGA